MHTAEIMRTKNNETVSADETASSNETASSTNTKDWSQPCPPGCKNQIDFTFLDN